MDQNGGQGNGGQAARDFLALSHGHEWANFYDSFDKLVQDNMARSSELLRHAMSLPEVADREVAEIKQEMADKLKAERAAAREAFVALQQAMLASQQQVENLAANLSSVVTEFGQLATKLADLVNTYSGDDEAPSAKPEAAVAEPLAAEEPAAAEPEETWTAAAEPAESLAAVADEMEVEPAAEVEEVAVAEAVSEESDDLGWSSDVSFADIVGGDEEATEEEASGSSSPQRPAWLAVARQGATS
ncbi:MAG: hypothetical protein ACJ789_09715 [Thermomicrobiales bacterium]